ncbi:hypothetical protein ACIQNG_25525 [Streptomyces sp. NPDC091377]|uniref:hypothetical protein n=1 Tax=Streptomyces sp. NPDC091377 TaxID=3365995 RepID=UPI0038149B07
MTGRPVPTGPRQIIAAALDDWWLTADPSRPPDTTTAADQVEMYLLSSGYQITPPGAATVTTTPAGDQQQPDAKTLAAALDGLHTLIATSSRDWGTYRVDAWLWAVLCGWDCEQAEHDDTCTHGAMEEMADRHGWDAATVAKARRYRAAVRALTEPAVPATPVKGA